MTPKKITSMFNDHFSTVGSKIEKMIPLAQGDFKEYFNKKDGNGNLVINPMYSFFLAPTVPSEVEKLIDALDTSKSTCPNSIYS